MQSSVVQDGLTSIPAPNIMGVYDQLSTKSRSYIDKMIRTLAVQDAAKNGGPTPMISAPILRLLPSRLA